MLASKELMRTHTALELEFSSINTSLPEVFSYLYLESERVKMKGFHKDVICLSKCRNIYNCFSFLVYILLNSFFVHMVCDTKEKPY